MENKHECKYNSGLVEAKIKASSFIGNPEWNLDITRSSGCCSIPIRFCPFCGEDLLNGDSVK